MPADLQKMMRFGVPNSKNDPNNTSKTDAARWDQERVVLENQIVELKTANADALRAVKTYKTELNRQLLINKQSQNVAQKAVQQYYDGGKTSKNTSLQALANSLSDALSDKEEYIEHLKTTLKLLGDRVRELETELTTVRRNSVLGKPSVPSKQPPDKKTRS